MSYRFFSLINFKNGNETIPMLPSCLAKWKNLTFMVTSARLLIAHRQLFVVIVETFKRGNDVSTARTCSIPLFCFCTVKKGLNFLITCLVFCYKTKFISFTEIRKEPSPAQKAIKWKAGGWLVSSLLQCRRWRGTCSLVRRPFYSDPIS